MSTRHLRIAVVGSRGVPGDYSGIEVSLAKICPRLVERGHSVTVYGRHNADYTGAKFHGVTRCELPTLHTKHLETIILAAQATLRASFARYDIIHFHALGPSTLSFIPRLLRRRVVTTVHGLDWERAKWGRVARTYLLLGEWTSARLGHAVVTVSESLRKYYDQKYGIRAVWIPNGVDAVTPVGPERIRSDYGLGERDYLLFASRLVPEKGCHDLIQAFRQVDAPVRLVIAGVGEKMGDYEHRLREMAGSDSRILFTGFVTGRVKEELFSNALAFVLPSQIEGMPVALLEAMAYGVYPVASDLEPNREVMGELGMRVPPRDAQALSVALESVLRRRDLLATEAATCRERVLREYSWDRAAAAYDALYAAVAQTGHDLENPV